MYQHFTVNKFAKIFPVIVVFLLALYSESVIQFSHSILGKLLAVGIIVFYTILDKYVGLFVCALVLLYYQMDVVEKSLNPLTPEAFVEYNEQYDTEGVSTDTTVQQIFREQNCKTAVLTHKGMAVKPDMAEHVFPELKFKGGTCNPCVKGCRFSIIESKLKTQGELAPIHSK